MRAIRKAWPMLVLLAEVLAFFRHILFYGHYAIPWDFRAYHFSQAWFVARSFARAPVLSHSCATPRRAGSQRLAWFTPLTGTSSISDMCLSRVRRMPALS